MSALTALLPMATALLQIVGGIDGGIGFGMVDAGQLVLSSVKIMFVLAGLLYVVFAILVLRQVYIMKNTVITSFSPIVLLLGFAHLVVAIMVFVFFLGL